MARHAEAKPQLEQKHPEPWQQDLSPDRMGSQNIGAQPDEAARTPRTAYDVKAVHRALRDFTDDELKQIPILEPGTRLQIGATYLDLDQGEFTVPGERWVSPGQKIVPKDGLHYAIWNRLTGAEKP